MEMSGANARWPMHAQFGPPGRNNVFEVRHILIFYTHHANSLLHFCNGLFVGNMYRAALRQLIRPWSLPPRLFVVAAGRRHHSSMAPPFLLDDYMPRYQLLSATDAAKKRSLAYMHLRNCNLCPRLCGVNRFEKTGTCLIGADVKVNTIAPHFGEGILPTPAPFSA